MENHRGRLFWDYCPCPLLYRSDSREADNEVYARMGPEFEYRAYEWARDMDEAWGETHDENAPDPPFHVIEDLQARHTVLADEMRTEGFVVKPKRKYTPKDDQRRPLYATIRDLLNGWARYRRQWPYGPEDGSYRITDSQGSVTPT